MRERWAQRPVLLGVGIGLAALVTALVTEHWLGWLLIAGLLAVGIWGVRVVLRQLRRERESKLERGLERNTRERPALPEESSPLDERFRELLAELRGRRGGRGRTRVYDLPWFVVLGEPGAGKTALLQECGLDLPAQYFQRAAGATQDCEFVLSNDAIAIDTTGRWFRCATERDTAEWRRFLGLLRRTRPRGPLEGIVVALPVPVLLARSAAELEEQARELRRRLNELRVSLEVDAPIYLVLTKADALDGFAETVRHLPRGWLQQAFGWTNPERRLPDPEGRVETALGALAARVEAFVPELLLRETDRVRQRRVLGFPRELEVLARATGRFAGVAFKRDAFGEQMPFLRGVYLTSARVEAAAMSTVLRRLGLAWADTRRSEESWRGLFTRDFVLDVVCGDEGLALPDGRLGPAVRRAIGAAAAFTALGIVSIWGLSFAQNYRGTQELVQFAQKASLPQPTLADLSEFWRRISAEERNASSPVQWVGYNQLDDAAARSKQVYCAAFARNFDRAAREARERALQRQDEVGVRALIELARDIEFVATRGADRDGLPEWRDYLPPAVSDAQAYNAAYTAFVRWLSQRDREDILRASRQSLAAAQRVVRLPPLEAISSRPGSSLPPVSYADAGLTAGGAANAVPGIYTPAGTQLIRQLLGVLEPAGALTGEEIADFRTQYAERYTSTWRRYFLATPVVPRAAVDPKSSPYLSVLQKVDENMSSERLGGAQATGWAALLHAVRNTNVDLLDRVGARLGGDGKPVAPWVAYQQALDAVALQTEEAASDGEKSLLLAQDVATGKPNPYSSALDVIVRVIPRDDDSEARAKLRALMEAPVLDAFSAVLERARGALDRSWKEKIARPFSGELASERMAELYDRESGALARFLAGDLGPFFRDGKPRKLLGDRELPVREGVVSWIAWAQANGAVVARAAANSAPRTLRVRGVPSVVVAAGPFDGSTLRVTRRDLRVVCPDGDQTFVYREGSGEQLLKWGPGCDEISLRVLVAGSTPQSQQELRRSWSGPRALTNFVRDGRVTDGRVRAWAVESADGIVVQVRYEVVSGGGSAAEPIHRSPPQSLGG